MSIGLTLPLIKASGSLGYFEVTRDELSAVRENIRSLLVTNWGERVMHYDMGCNLIEFLFTNERSFELKEKISDRIISQMAKWLPFVGIKSLNVLFSEDDSNLSDHTIGVRIEFYLKNRPDLSSLIELALTP